MNVKYKVAITVLLKDRLRALSFTSLAHFANDGTSLLYPILITFYDKLPGIQITYLGSMVIIYNLISGTLSTPIGRYADRTGSYGVLLSVGIALLGVTSVILALPFAYPAYILPLLIVGSVFMGSGQAFYHPLGATILRNTYGLDAPKAMGVNGSFGSLGRAVMPTTVGFIMVFIGEFQGLMVYSAYSFISALVLYLGLREVKVRKEKPVAAEKPKESHPTTRLRGSRFMPFLYILTAAVFIRSLFMVGTSTFIPTYLTQEYGSVITLTIILITYLLPVFGQPFFGSLTTRKGGRFTIVVTYIMSAIFFGLFLISGHNVIFTILSFGFFAFSAYSGFPVLLGYVGQIVPRDALGRSNSIVWGIGQTIGGAVGAAVVSVLALFVSVGTAIEYMFIFAIVSLVFLPLLPSKKKSESESGRSSPS